MVLFVSYTGDSVLSVLLDQLSVTAGDANGRLAHVLALQALAAAIHTAGYVCIIKYDHTSSP